MVSQAKCSSGSSRTSFSNRGARVNVDGVQSRKLITGAMKSTPIKSMEEITGIPPLSQRRNAKLLIQARKYYFLPDHPMKLKLDSLTKNRLQRSSFVHEVKKLSKTYSAKLGPPVTQLKLSDLPSPW